MNNRGLWLRVTLMTMLLSVALVGCVARLGTSWAGLTVLDNGTQIVFAYENTLAIIDVREGQPVSRLDADGNEQLTDTGTAIPWQVNGNDLDNAKFFASPLQLNDETLLVATLEKRLLLFDIATGSFAEGAAPLEGRGNALTGLVGADNLILMGLQDQLLALDSAEFTPEWSVGTTHAVWGEPLVIDGVIYVASLDHFLYAVSPVDGEVIWRLDLGGAGTATPVYDAEEGVLFVGTLDSTILRISLDGEIEATYETDEWVWGAPVLVDNMLYAADLGGYVYKLDPQTLSEENGWRVRAAEGAIRTPPVVFEDYVVVGSRDQSVYWLNRDTGSEIFNRPLDGEVLSNVLYFAADDDIGLDESLIVVSTLSNRESLVAFGATNGERIWTYRR